MVKGEMEWWALSPPLGDGWLVCWREIPLCLKHCPAVTTLPLFLSVSLKHNVPLYLNVFFSFCFYICLFFFTSFVSILLSFSLSIPLSLSVSLFHSFSQIQFCSRTEHDSSCTWHWLIITIRSTVVEIPCSLRYSTYNSSDLSHQSVMSVCFVFHTWS